MADFNRDFNRRRSDRSRFDRKRPGTFGRRDMGRGRSSKKTEMHSAVCDKCGKDCEVPFKPTQGKPLYCDDCFKDKRTEAGPRPESGKQSNENLEQINRKLDRILKILEATKEPVEEKPELKKPDKIEEEKPKKKAKKKPKKKK